MKDVKDYLHLYLGCDVEYGYESRKKIGELVGKHSEWGWQVFTRQVLVTYHHVRDELIKPILRRLSSMTEEEKKEYVRLMCTNGFVSNFGDIEVGEIETSKLTGESFRVTAEMFHQGKPKGTYCGTETLYNYNSRQLIFLLSKSFDLFNLIDSGLAIDRDTLNNSELTIKQ